MLVGVSDGTTSSLYVDGVLNSSGALLNGLAGEPGVDLFLGGDAGYTSVGINQRYFAGAISQAALFTNALTAPQVAALYSAAVLPSISVSLSGGNAVVTYSGTLWSSTNAAGPFFQVQGAQPPTYSVPATEPRLFYRTSNP